jgi:hypothetical protein
MTLVNHSADVQGDYLSGTLSSKKGWVRSAVMIGILSMSAGVLAATQMNDQELDQKYLKDDGALTKIDVQQVYRQTVLKDINKILLTFIPVDGLSTLTFLLNDNDRQQLANLGVFKFSDSFGEFASYEFGSEPYSYRWAGNYDRIYDLARFNNFYYNNNTGNYEIDGNIRGRVDLEISTFDDGRRLSFYRNNYVF